MQIRLCFFQKRFQTLRDTDMGLNRAAWGSATEFEIHINMFKTLTFHLTVFSYNIYQSCYY